MKDSISLIGGGGHGLVVAEAAQLSGLALAGFFDDAAAPVLLSGTPRCERLGSFADAERHTGSAIIAIGDLTLRRKLIAKFRSQGMTVIHPRAIVSPSATIGRGVYIGPGAVVHTRASIADHAILNSGCIIEHEVSIGENAHVAPGAAVGGRATIGADSLIGIGARVLPGMSIGRSCVIGCGAAVIRPVADSQHVAGVPARPLHA